MNAKRLCQTAVLAALVFIITRFVQIPIPCGYATLGNTVILLAAVLLPGTPSILIAGIGSALADLLSFPIYALPTLVIKCLMVVVFHALGAKNKRTILAAVVSLFIPVIGYALTGIVIYGFKPGLTQIPGLLIEYALNLILFILLQKSVKTIRDRV